MHANMHMKTSGSATLSQKILREKTQAFFKLKKYASMQNIARA
jgi:hypothetical protein